MFNNLLLEVLFHQIVYIADASYSVENDTIYMVVRLLLAPLSVQNIAIGKTAIASSNVGPAQQAID